MIQNGVVNIESPDDAAETAAFTLYKRADTGDSGTTPTSTKGGMTTQQVAQKVIPSVVCVQNYQIVQQQNSFFGNFVRGKLRRAYPRGRGLRHYHL